MPIINNLSGNEIEILKLSDFLTGTEHDITDVYFGELQIFTVWGETEGTLPLTINANGEPLIDYKIYGNTVQNGTPDPQNPVDVMGCGVRTENLFDRSDETQFIENTNLAEANAWIKYDGVAKVLRIACEPTTTYTLKIFGDMSENLIWRVSYTSSDSIPIEKKRVQTTDIIKTAEYNETTFTTFSTTKYILIQVSIACNDTLAATLTLTKGSTAPVTYVPYGYKLPLTSSNTPVDIYIGDTPLAQGEYVDYGEQKVYEYVDGVLTPTDPPVPLPEIPTTAGETTIDYTDTPAPSKMYVKYRKHGT